MSEESNRPFRVMFKEEFDLCLDRIERFFAEQGPEPLQWWYAKEDEIIDYIGWLAGVSSIRGTGSRTRQLQRASPDHIWKKPACVLELPDLLRRSRTESSGGCDQYFTCAYETKTCGQVSYLFQMDSTVHMDGLLYGQ